MTNYCCKEYMDLWKNVEKNRKSEKICKANPDLQTPVYFVYYTIRNCKKTILKFIFEQFLKWLFAAQKLFCRSLYFP